MKILFTALIILGYLGHSALYWSVGQSELSVAMICLAMAMWLLF